MPYGFIKRKETPGFSMIFRSQFILSGKYFFNHLNKGILIFVRLKYHSISETINSSGIYPSYFEEWLG